MTNVAVTVSWDWGGAIFVRFGSSVNSRGWSRDTGYAGGSCWTMGWGGCDRSRRLRGFWCGGYDGSLRGFGSGGGDCSGGLWGDSPLSSGLVSGGG